MESLKERNAFFVEVLQRPEEARGGYGKKALSKELVMKSGK